MENKVYGFLIDQDILFDIMNKRLIRVTDDSSVNSITVSLVSLNVTLMRLLTLLLASGGIVLSKEDILNDVWGKHDLCSSRQRLWHAIKELRRKLLAIGLPDDFILSVRDTGYFINGQHKVTSLLLG